MKSLRLTWSLIGCNLRLLPWYLWPLLAAILLLARIEAPILNRQWTIGGYNTTRLTDPGFFSFILLGSMFCRARAGHAEGLIPGGGFSSSYPVSLRTFHGFRTALYFAIILAAPLLELSMAGANPDLRVEFFDASTPALSADGLARQRFYQDQFPESRIVHETTSVGHRIVHYDVLVIPSGALRVARWNLFAAVIIALALQIGMFFPVSYSWDRIGPYRRMFSAYGTLIIIYLLASVVIAMMFPHFNAQTTLFEHAFFFFAHRGFLLTLLAFDAFVLVQWIVLKRIRNLEVNPVRLSARRARSARSIGITRARTGDF